MAYRQEIRRTFIKLELWDKAIIIRNGKKETRYFTEHQRKLLLVEPSFYDYVRAKSDDEGLRGSSFFVGIFSALDFSDVPCYNVNVVNRTIKLEVLHYE